MSSTFYRQFILLWLAARMGHKFALILEGGDQTFVTKFGDRVGGSMLCRNCETSFMDYPIGRLATGRSGIH